MPKSSLPRFEFQAELENRINLAITEQYPRNWKENSITEKPVETSKSLFRYLFRIHR